MLKFFRIMTIALLLLWMLLIFNLSAENATASSKTSGSLITAVVKIFYPDFNGLSSEKQAEIVSGLQFAARKAAHFTLYAILGALAFLSLITFTRINAALRIGLSSVICLLYSVSDELHQLYVPGRSGEIRDVFIDFSGSIIAIALLYLVVKFSKFKTILNRR